MKYEKNFGFHCMLSGLPQLGLLLTFKFKWRYTIQVHLLADERGAVIESIVSRFHRLVESRQRQVRIVALSATLPNYGDVAEFLQVHKRGLFFFGPEHRPVPLRQQYIGVTVKTKDRNIKEQKLNDTCFSEVIDSLKQGHQVMVFVHSRKGMDIEGLSSVSC
jgi:activating signal cointegrator complex subunit 3